MEINLFLSELNHLFIDDDIVVSESTAFEEIDSLSKMSLCSWVETELKVSVKYNELENFNTIEDLYKYIMTFNDKE
jgi:acyl carrier protein